MTSEPPNTPPLSLQAQMDKKVWERLRELRDNQKKLAEVDERTLDLLQGRIDELMELQRETLKLLLSVVPHDLAAETLARIEELGKSHDN